MDAVVDTSILLMPFSQGLDLMAEMERVLGTVRPVLAGAVRLELEHLVAGGGAVARAAKGSLRLTSDWHQESTDLPGDDGVLDVARRLGAAVVTNDRRMQQEAMRSRLPVVIVRGHGLSLRQ